MAWWTLSTVAFRVIMVWLFNNTGRSVFDMALIHMTSNVSWQLFPIQGSYFDYRVFGLLLAVVAAIVVLVWRPGMKAGGRRRDKLSRNSETAHELIFS